MASVGLGWPRLGSVGLGWPRFWHSVNFGVLGLCCLVFGGHFGGCSALSTSVGPVLQFGPAFGGQTGVRRGSVFLRVLAGLRGGK
eukprot:6086325-Lingulodinium_polyedra.AAC.1